MIELPRRSVTRFFIPLIDVLTLLFCIFLVLPLAKEPGDSSADVTGLEERLREKEQEVERLRQAGRDMPRELREEIDKLRQEKGKALQQRLRVRVLEIDADTGKLYYRDPERIPVPDEAAAHALIESDHRKSGQRELYYLILYPRTLASGYPTRGQRESYDRWFEGVALGYDVPSASGGRLATMTTDGLVKVLAVVGGGVLGGGLLGLLAQLLAKAFTIRPLPRWPAILIRLLGAVICGWLVALWLFGGGGPGIGGTGGFGFGSGAGKGGSEKTSEVAKINTDDKKPESEERGSAAETLRVEVLGRAILSKEDVQAARWYRIDTEDGSRLLTFAQLKEVVKRRQEKQPPLRHVAIVVYKDSPDERGPLVSPLRTWAGDLDGGKMKVDVSKPDADAPMK